MRATGRERWDGVESKRGQRVREEGEEGGKWTETDGVGRER